MSVFRCNTNSVPVFFRCNMNSVPVYFGKTRQTRVQDYLWTVLVN